MNNNKLYWPIFVLAIVILVLKLFVSYNVYGTNDVMSWEQYASELKEVGTFDIYDKNPDYNHPPLISWFLLLINFIMAKTGLGFPFVFRFFAIFVDLVSLFVIWHMLKGRVKGYKMVVAICCINPVNFLISSYHGNTDTIMVFFILVAIYFALSDRIALAGLFFGLSICVKIVPLMLIPAFIFSLAGRKRKSLFVLFSMILPLAVFLPYLIHDSLVVFRNIFLYSSRQGIWGIGFILQWCYGFGRGHLLLQVLRWLIIRHLFYSKFIFLISLMILFTRPFLKKINLLEGIFMTFCLFFIVTPGFGVQYLSWLSYFAIMYSPILGIIYLALGELFLVRVYGYWGGWTPPYFADSRFCLLWPWVGFEAALGLILWAFIIFMFVKFLLDKYRLFYGHADQAHHR